MASFAIVINDEHVASVTTGAAEATVSVEITAKSLPAADEVGPAAKTDVWILAYRFLYGAYDPDLTEVWQMSPLSVGDRAELTWESTTREFGVGGRPTHDDQDEQCGVEDDDDDEDEPEDDRPEVLQLLREAMSYLPDETAADAATNTLRGQLEDVFERYKDLQPTHRDGGAT